jgi:hypothetical protein
MDGTRYFATYVGHSVPLNLIQPLTDTEIRHRIAAQHGLCPCPSGK